MCGERQDEEEKVHREDLTLYPATRGIAGEEREMGTHLCPAASFPVCIFRGEENFHCVCFCLAGYL